MSEGPYGRTSFEFDTIDADITDAAGPQVRDLFQEDETKPFALLRIVTTITRFLVFDGDVPTPGDWFFLEIEPRGARPGLMTLARPARAGGLLEPFSGADGQGAPPDVRG